MEARRPPSLPSVQSGGADICRICHCEGEGELPLISPCQCAGSLRYVHQVCLQQWINSSDTRRCELCKFEFLMQTRVKPFRKWEKLDMSPIERRKMFCSITFHVIAITCVIWSLYVLIDRTAEELRSGSLDWPFWTKLVVVAIGFTGGLVFMYVQCKVYVQLFRRWRAYNRIIFVQSVPKKPLTALAEQRPPSSGAAEEFHSCDSGGEGSQGELPPPPPPTRPSQHFTVDIETQTDDHSDLT